MPLVNVFIGMALICFGVCAACTVYGWSLLLKNQNESAERAFFCAKDAGWSMVTFAAVALFGLFFI